MDIKDFLESIKMPQQRIYTPKLSRWLVLLILIVLAIITLKTTIYTIPTDSAGVVKRFGQYNRTTEPGYT